MNKSKMQKNVLLSLLFLLVLIKATYSSPIKVYGIVKDLQTREVLAFANMGLKKFPIGTCTNLSGEFQLIVDDSLANEPVMISMIGYESKEYKLCDLKSKYVEILLNPVSIQIGEVLVFSKQLTGEDILKSVIKNHSKNYPYGFCFYEAFFRDILTDDHPDAKIKNCRLTEAALSIEDFGLDAFRDPKFKVQEIRNSYSYVDASNWSKALILKIENPLQFIYSWRNQMSKAYLKALLKDNCYSKKISEITYLDSSLVYVLDLRQENIKYLGITYPTNKLYIKKRLFVNSRDWAITDVISEYVYKSTPTDSVVFQDVHIKMQEYNTYYYLKLIDYKGYLTDEYFKIGNDVDYKHKLTILVNNVFEDRKSIERIRKRNAMKVDIPLWNIEYTYNSEFWKTYNIFLDKPLDPTVRKDLEYEIPLENQFIDGGLKNSKK